MSHSHDDPADRLVTLAKTRSEFEANMLVAQLESEGIEAFAFSGVHGAFPLGSRFFQIPVQVRESDLEAARTVLREQAVRSETLDWEDVDVGERQDTLPLRKPGRMPMAARIGYVIAWIVIGLSLLGLLLFLIGGP